MFVVLQDHGGEDKTWSTTTTTTVLMTMKGNVDEKLVKEEAGLEEDIAVPSGVVSRIPCCEDGAATFFFLSLLILIHVFAHIHYFT